MRLPIEKGIVYHTAYDSNSFCKARNGILILPTTNFNIRSCTSGQVFKISKLEPGQGYQVIVKTRDTFYCYSFLDDVSVKPNQRLYQGDLLGTKNKGRDNESSCIALSVLKNKRELNEANFLVFK
jgi:hypothetical protein